MFRLSPGKSILAGAYSFDELVSGWLMMLCVVFLCLERDLLEEFGIFFRSILDKCCLLE